MTPQSRAEFPQLDSGLVVPMFQQGEDPIECINKAMAFLSAVASRFLPSNNQLRTLSNPRNQATIQDGRVTVQQVQGIQYQSYAGTRNRGIATTSKGKVTVGPPREAGQILDEEQLAFLVDLDDLDAYDLDYDDLSSAKAVLIANLSSCDPEVLTEVPYSDSYPNDMINQDVQEMQYSEQTHDTNPSAPNDLLVLSLVEQMTDHVAHLDKEKQTNKMINKSLTAELERYKERITIFEKCEAFRQEIDTLKETISNNVKEKESISKTLTVFKTESKEKESKYIDKEIILEKQNKELENIISLGYQNPFHLKKAQRIQPTLYDGSVLAKEHVVIYVYDDEETLILEEESRSKMLDKKNDPISRERNIKISPIDYS
ncbi:hypothetical protein Tco_0204365 [Tanacetum coccineum]